MKHSGIIVIVLFYLVLSGTLKAQSFYRFKADYTLKLHDKTGKPTMKMGTVFYDKNFKKLVVKNGFPVKELAVSIDTATYFIRVGRVIKKMTNLSPVEFSIFHLALNGDLNNFGLEQAGYVLEDAVQDKGLVITSWLPKNNFNDKLGKVLIATKNKNLYSIVFLDTRENTIAKHIFHRYMNYKGFVFPTEIVRIYYHDKKESYEVTTYRNIKVNESGNEEYYNYKIPE